MAALRTVTCLGGATRGQRDASIRLRVNSPTSIPIAATATGRRYSWLPLRHLRRGHGHAERGHAEAHFIGPTPTETYRVSRRTGDAKFELPLNTAAIPLLEHSDVRLPAELRETIERCFGRAVDVEWTIEGSGRVHVLQARPITALPEEQVFDNTNIVESFPGVTLPLTFSFSLLHAKRIDQAAPISQHLLRSSSNNWGTLNPQSALDPLLS